LTPRTCPYLTDPYSSFKMCAQNVTHLRMEESGTYVKKGKNVNARMGGEG
jgi:hypothetical protein